MSAYDDGAWTTAAQTGTDVYSFDEDTKSLLVQRTMVIKATSWTTLARGTAGPTVGATTTKLLGETAPRHVGNGIVEWERTYGAIPSSRNEYEDYVFGYQNIYVDYTTAPPNRYVILSGTELLSVPLLVSSRLAYAYFDAASTAPGAITLLNAFVVGEAGGSLYLLGDIPASLDTEIVAENSIIRRWRNSDFYERITRYVPRDALEEALTPP